MASNSYSRRRFVTVVTLGSAAGRFLSAQQVQQTEQAPPTFSTDVKVVNVFASVRDKDGRIVKDLTKDDFAVLEDGRPQAIRYFAQQTDLPLTLGLLVDTSMSERRMIPTERSASVKFFEQVLRPEKDKAFIIHFDREIELLEDLTSSREQLEKALDQLHASEPQRSASNDPNDPNSGGNSGGGRSSGGGGMGWPGGGIGFPGGGGRRGGGGYPRQGEHHVHMGGTAFYDAIYLASDEIMKKQAGRKALIMLTDGDDNASKISLGEAITSAQRADTLGYSIRVVDEEIGSMVRGYGGGGGSDHKEGKKILQQISKQTGGGFFESSKKKSLTDIYSQIEEELRNQYSIGYSSDKPSGDMGYRKIDLSVKQKGLVVQAREGYFA
jgi:VWFA-related protein